MVVKVPSRGALLMCIRSGHGTEEQRRRFPVRYMNRPGELRSSRTCGQQLPTMWQFGFRLVSSDVFCDFDRRGNHGCACVRHRRELARLSTSPTASSRSTSRNRAGSSTTRPRSSTRCAPRSPKCAVASKDTIAAIGITNQRETVVAWSRSTGKPLHRALVWQDRRTADVCDALGAIARHGATPRQDSCSTRISRRRSWRGCYARAASSASDDLMVGTIDTWLLWNLTGEYATDVSNASRTLLCDISTRTWDDELIDLFGVQGVDAAGDPAVVGPLRRDRTTAYPSRASPATSRRRCSARRASRPG